MELEELRYKGKIKGKSETNKGKKERDLQNYSVLAVLGASGIT